MILTTCLCIALSVQELDPPKLPKGVIALVDGRQVTLEAYKEYLWRQVGKLRLQLYIDEMLLEKKAADLGIKVTDDTVETRVEERIQREIEGFFKSDLGKWKEHLAKRDQTIAAYKEQLAQRVRLDLLRGQCVLKTRKITEDKLRRRFEKLYGKNGISYDLRHILVSVPGMAGAKRDPGKEAKAREKAERILRELKAGSDFSEMVSLYSDDHYTRKNGGRIPYYQPGKYGAEFDAATALLTAENPLSGIVKGSRGFHLIQLLKKRVTLFDKVKADLEKLLKTEAPSAREKYDFIKQLRDEARIIR